VRVLAIDPALRSTGFAVVEPAPAGTPGTFRALGFGTVVNPPGLRQSACLVAIREHLGRVIAEHRPTCCAVESVIYVQSFKTAIVLGAARGAAVLAAAEHGLPVHEYPPKRVKQAVVGRGAAHKDQVAFMVRALLGLTETPPADAADALAIALAHLYAMSRDPALPPGGTLL
jgi:crossover junction endodeoxyribonuclease RuvC